jgi:leucyl/phenylalanyl-tRNA---protein transferase
VTELQPETLLKAYAIGVFPMAESRDDPRMFFVDPDKRGVISLAQPHISRSLRKVVRRAQYDVRCDTAFEAVLDGCAEVTQGRPDTWINPEIRRLYLELAKLGRCHSVEVWSGDTLVGGLYGVALGGAFFGESMFSRVTNASKIAMVHLVARLRAGGFSLLDCQFITDHLRQFGAEEISRAAYHTLLEDALRRPAEFHSLPDEGALIEALLQSSTQMS